jgi:hypothetical protein
MVWPLVICNGIVRSGSTWSFNVCRLLAQIRAGRRDEKYISGFIDGKDLEKFFDTLAFTFDGMGVFKTHTTGPVAREWIRLGRAKAVCTFRDPRDCVASDLPFMNQGFDTSVQRVAIGLRALDGHPAFGRTLFIRYEDMFNDRAEHIRLIAAYLHIPVDRATVDAIEQQTSLENCRKLCAQIPSMGTDVAPMLDTIPHRRHLETLLHENHIGKVTPGRWKTDLTDSQRKSVNELFSHSLLTLGYETPQSIQQYLAPTQSGDYSADSNPQTPAAIQTT